LVGLVRTAHLSAQGGCPEVERVGQWPSGRGGIEAKTGAPVAGLRLNLLLLLKLLLLLLKLSLSQQLCLILLRLDSLNPHHLKLEHLHLHLSLGHHIGCETRAEGHAVGVHASGGLLMRETVGGTVYGCGHGDVPVVEDVLLGHFSELVLFLFLWEDVGIVMGREAGDVESSTRSSRVGNGARC
jgi:hypothetical protein